MAVTRVPHPIPYQGSKRALAPAILRFLPADTPRLIEPFAGSAALTIATAHYGLARSFVVNDTNAPLIALWRAIIETPEALATAYAQLWHDQIGHERAFYAAIRTEFNRTQQPAHLLYLLARCVKAAVRYNRDGAFNQSPDHRRRGAHPQTMRRHIVATSALLHDRITLSAQDYRAVLAGATSHDLIYLDPPYQGVSGGRDRRYVAGSERDDFVAALEQLNTRGMAYLVSFDGRSGAKRFGLDLPAALDLQRIELAAGRSAQATLLGRTDQTVESLYLSPALRERLDEALHAGQRAERRTHRVIRECG